MDVVAADDVGETFNILPDITDANVRRRGLEENSRGRSRKWDGCPQDNGSNDQRDCWICVELARQVRQPYNQGGNNNTNIANPIADDMKDHSFHAQVLMIMASAFTGLLGQ